MRWKRILLLVVLCSRQRVDAGDAPVLNPLSVPPNIAIGDIIEIYCSIKRGTLPIEFKWFHNGVEINTHSKYKISTSKINSLFLIGEIQASDIGNFTCVAGNTYGVDSKTENVFMEASDICNVMYRTTKTLAEDSKMEDIYMKVMNYSKMSRHIYGLLFMILAVQQGIQANDVPVLNSMFVPENIAVGDITEISCTIKRGSLPVEFKWLHNGQEVKSHSKYKVTAFKTSSRLYIGEIQAADIGNFTCVASNAYGVDSKTENVFMEGEITRNIVK